MDILNFISWIRGKRQVTSVDPAKTLIPVGLKDPKRDDDYIAGAITVADLSNQIGGLQTVAVDGTTIQGDGTPSNPLFANFLPSVNIYNSNGTLTGNRILSGNSKNLEFDNLANFLITMNSGVGWQFGSIGQNIVTYDVNGVNGIRLNLGNKNYTFGQISSDNRTQLFINDTLQLIKTSNNNTDKGLKLDFANRTYELGQINGNNATTLKIDDAAAYPVQISGTSVSANTAGASSGQFLKIKVNGVDYKIALLNP